MTSLRNFLSLNSKWELSPSLYVLIVTLFNTLVFNVSLYSFIASKLDVLTLSGFSILATVFIIVFIVNLLAVTLITVTIPKLLKPLLVILSLLNAAALYHMVTYQVILDKTMIGNILNTRGSEAVELFSFTLVIYLFFIGVVPSWLACKVSIKEHKKVKTFFQMMLVTILCSVYLFSTSANWLWVDKYAKILGGKVLPWSYIINSGRYYSEVSRSAENQQLLPLGTFSNNNKVAVVLVIGETARANNFSLYGYPRNTNPLLSKENITTFPNSTSCTTYTTGSVACILSHDISVSNAEPLPSYLTRMGVDVVWRTNNWGEPVINVSDYQKRAELQKECHGEYCKFDNALLSNLSKKIKSSTKDKTFVVLHTKGSHGPSYYSRYPVEFETFTPVCRNEEVSKCTQQELINAYDNTIVFTDFLLKQTITELEQLTDIPTMLIYISDHGESLGENGLYLHGTPYTFAPALQKEVPFIIWQSDSFIQMKNTEIKLGDKYSQENIFHTVLGALDIESEIYKKELDVFN